MYPNIIYPLGYAKCDGCGYPTGAPIPLGAHKYCGDCYAKGTIKATASPLNSSEIEGLRRLLEERDEVESRRAARAPEHKMIRSDVDAVNRYRADAARLHLMANEMSWAMAHHPGCGITADCVSQVVHYFVRLRQSAEA